MVYVGKGGYGRAITSAKAHGAAKALIWTPTQTEKGAFVAEYMMQLIRQPNSEMVNTYNKIWSLGKKIFEALTKI